MQSSSLLSAINGNSSSIAAILSIYPHRIILLPSQNIVVIALEAHCRGEAHKKCSG